ncbi:hypothetical protein Tco_1515085 [Tanacetum coccineum]
MEILPRLKDVKMMRMKIKNPPLDQTVGPREEELEKNLSQLVHHRRRLPSQLASLKMGPNLIKILLANFSAFVLNQLKVDTLTLELLVGPTFELMKGLCKSLVELEYFLEEFCKATTDQLDWYNPEGQQYPYDLRMPLPLIPNLRGRQVIPFDHFINNDLAYLNEWIAVCRDDDNLYTFKEGDYNRLRLQDIEDMLPLLVQGKLTNLNIKERLALGVSLRMFTRSIVIRRHVEDLQLGIESYQKKLNLTRPDTYISDLKRKSAYTTYSNPKGFIYQNKDKKNKLMHIDELHKFSDGTLNDVRSALDDILKRIRMEYLPQTI